MLGCDDSAAMDNTKAKEKEDYRCQTRYENLKKSTNFNVVSRLYKIQSRNGANMWEIGQKYFSIIPFVTLGQNYTSIIPNVTEGIVPISHILATF